MTKKDAELRVGITALLAILILVFGIVWVKEIKPGRKTYVLHTEFLNSGGIAPGTPVSVNGVAKGSVRSITLSNDIVKIDLRIERDVILREDATVSIRSAGLMGEKEVAIFTGVSAKPFDLSKPLEGSYAGDFTVVMEQLSDVLTSVSSIAEVLGVQSDTTGKAPGQHKGLGGLFAFGEELRKMAQENRADLRKAVIDFRASGEDLRRMIAANSPRVSATMQGFEASSRRLDRAIVKFDSLSTELEQVAAKANHGDGTVSKLLNESTLHDDLRKTIAEANALIVDIKANPSKYVKLKVF